MVVLLASIALALQALASNAMPLTKRDVVIPVIDKAEVVANVTDPSLTRDSCVSIKVKSRTLWTCRDTNLWDAKTNKPILPLVVNTAAWTDFKNDGTPNIVINGPVGCASNGSNPILKMYGSPDPSQKIPFYPLSQPDACTLTAGGKCDDGTRTVVWQDSAPMVASSRTKGKTIAYTWIANWHIDKLAPAIKQPAYSLYRMEYDNTIADKNTLPTNKLVTADFWKEGDIGYGAYGRVVRHKYAYLYGQGLSRNSALARVHLKSIEDKSKYEFFVNGNWTSKKPTPDNKDAWIPNAGGGKQGRFWYSEYFNQFMWVGQRNMSLGPDFYMTTAPAPEGPWVKPFLIYSGKSGDGDIPNYSLQAHPALLKDPKQNGIYLTWTQTFKDYLGYVTPLVYVTFK